MQPVGYTKSRMGEGKKPILWGLFLTVTGWSIIFLIVLEVIPSLTVLNFFAYTIFMIGFVMGMSAVFTQIQLNKVSKQHELEQQKLMDGSYYENDYDEDN